MLKLLGVNVDHVATVRQARAAKEPSPVTAAILAELAGADAMVVHLREDRRHIRDRDVFLLRESIRVPLDLEMAATDEMVKLAIEVRPAFVTLVPEKRQELTTEGGLNLVSQHEGIKKAMARLQAEKIAVMLFIDPEMEQIKAAHKMGADGVELHTGRYANSQGTERQSACHHVVEAAKMVHKLGMKVSAGHGLDYRNVAALASVPEIESFNIGHSIIARAILVGIPQAVKEMKALLGAGCMKDHI